MIMDAQELQRLKNKYDIIGNDAALNRALETAVAVAPTDLTVLITGESGVGKDVIPRIIHQYSGRKNGKFLAVNCGAIPPGTINAELFGHEKGSFTGAVSARKGYFEEANGGTLFLDEIGEMPLETQAMLLRVLQNGEYLKVGSSVVEKTDVRVIVATNKNLLHAVGQGKFREDLYYRLNSVTVNMPALRERSDDIYLLFRKFTSDFAQKYRMCRVSLTHDAIAMLKSYRWPGNIRQLKSVTESITALESMNASLTADKCEIDSHILDKYIPKETGALTTSVLGGAGGGMNDSEKQMFVKALLDLKQEVDELKRVVYAHPESLAKPAIDSASRLAEPEEAEWQESDVEAPAPAPAPEPEPENLSLEKVERENILKALEKHHGNRKLAAAELGISERTLYRRIAKND